MQRFGVGLARGGSVGQGLGASWRGSLGTHGEAIDNVRICILDARTHTSHAADERRLLWAMPRRWECSEWSGTGWQGASTRQRSFVAVVDMHDPSPRLSTVERWAGEAHAHRACDGRLATSGGFGD